VLLATAMTIREGTDDQQAPPFGLDAVGDLVCATHAAVWVFPAVHDPLDDPHSALRVPINHPAWSGGVLVLAKGPAEAVTSADLQVPELCWFADRLG
jgi:hypothetical protein